MSSLHIVRPWDVYRVFAQGTTPPKTKRIIITHIPVGHEPYRALYINSRRNNFMSQPRALGWSVDIDGASHSFLDHDSVVGCDATGQFDGIYLTPNCFIGRVPQATAIRIVAAVRGCPLIKRIDKNEILGLVLPP